MEELQQRLIELESRYAHQGRLLEELNAEVLDCNRRLDRLERDNRMLREMLRALAPDTETSPVE